MAAGNTAASARAPPTPPNSCAIQYTIARRTESCRPTNAPSVTAGLKCPPEMWAKADAMTPIASPCSRATNTRFEVLEEPGGVGGNLRDQMIDSEQRLEDPVCLLATHPLVHEADRVQVLMQEDVERVGLVQPRVRLLNSKEGDLVHHDHVARDRIERTEEPLRMVTEIREGEHQARPRASEDSLDGPLHQLEDVGEGPRLVELRVEVHRPSERRR